MGVLEAGAHPPETKRSLTTEAKRADEDQRSGQQVRGAQSRGRSNKHRTPEREPSPPENRTGQTAVSLLNQRVSAGGRAGQSLVSRFGFESRTCS